LNRRTFLGGTAALLTAVALGACGGGGGSGGGGGDTADDLPGLAAQAQQFMTQQVAILASVQTKAELIDRLNEAQDKAHALSNAIEDVEAPPELYNGRAALALAMRTVTLDLGRVRALVQSGDLAGAKELLANVKSIQAVKDAIAEVQSARLGTHALGRELGDGLERLVGQVERIRLRWKVRIRDRDHSHSGRPCAANSVL
jgi:hypothetical protein